MDFIKEAQSEIGYEFPSDTVFVKSEGGLKLICENGRLRVFYENNGDIARALLISKAHRSESDYKVEEKRVFDDVCFMTDCSRNAVPNMATVKKLIRNVAMLGYNSMMLYTEDTYEVDNEPVFGYLRGRYTKSEIKEIDAYAKEFGIELIPCIQTLAHFDGLKRWYKDYQYHFDCEDILLVGDERVYTLIDNIFRTISECFTTKRIHIGMDEAHNIGRGAYLDKNGYRPTFDILLEHLQRVNELAQKYGFSLIMWSDMFWKIAYKIDARDENGNVRIPEEVLSKIPSNVSVAHWHYTAIYSEAYEERFRIHGDFKTPVWFAAAAHKCQGYVPKVQYSLKELDLAFSMVKKYGMKHVINTAWCDEGGEASVWSVLPVMAKFAYKAREKSTEDLQKDFYALTGYSWEKFGKIDYPDTFCGKYVDDTAMPCKIHLYNDLFLGQFDKDADEKNIEYFQRSAKILKRIGAGQYKYVFDMLADLSDLIALKYNMGVRIRTAYQSQNRRELETIAKDLAVLHKKTKKFYMSSKKVWYTDNKPNGFEILEYRLGGLMLRINSCRERILSYLSGECSEIPELNETILPADIFYDRNAQTGRVTYNSFHLTASVGKY